MEDLFLMSLPATDQIWPVEERRKDRWTIKRDFALETNEMLLIIKKKLEDLLLLLPCLLLLSPQQLSTCSLRMKINNGRKGFTQDHRAIEPSLTCLTVPSYRTSKQKENCSVRGRMYRNRYGGIPYSKKRDQGASEKGKEGIIKDWPCPLT